MHGDGGQQSYGPPPAVYQHCFTAINTVLPHVRIYIYIYIYIICCTQQQLLVRIIKIGDCFVVPLSAVIQSTAPMDRRLSRRMQVPCTCLLLLVLLLSAAAAAVVYRLLSGFRGWRRGTTTAVPPSTLSTGVTQKRYPVLSSNKTI